MIGVKLAPSHIANEDDPGHMAVYWRRDQVPICRGLRFKIESLPLEFHDPNTWRNYLFENAIEGLIVDDVSFYDNCVRGKTSHLSKKWSITVGSFTDLENYTKPGSAAKYSFNPDKNSADNCVTWATRVVRRFAGDVLQFVYEGRIKDVARQLEGKEYRKRTS